MKPRKIILLVLVIVVIIVVLLIGFVFKTRVSDIDARAVDLKVDEYMSELVKQKRFSGSVLIAKDGKPIVERSYGMANIEDKIPNTPQTKFRISSITMQFTAAAIMKLQEQGKLNVRDPIKKYLDDCPDAWWLITIHDLLTHVSGIPNYTESPNLLQISSQEISPIKVVELFKDKPLDFFPGNIFRWSNSGYYLLGLIIEKVSGISYQNFMHKTIFESLGMKNTGVEAYGDVVKNLSTGYDRQNNGFMKAKFYNTSILYSAGSIYSTVEDLSIWNQALYSGKFLSDKSLEAITIPYDIGYGGVDYCFNRKRISYNGKISGFMSSITHFPKEKICFIVLCNLTSHDLLNKINQDFASIIFGEKYELPKERKIVKIDPVIYDKYVGEYQLLPPDPTWPDIIITVTREENKLITQAAGQPKFEAFPISETNFTREITYLRNETEAEFEFIRDADDRVTLLVVRQAGLEVAFKKIHKKELSEYKVEAGSMDFYKNLKSHGFDPGDINKLIGLIEKGTYQNIHSLIIMRGGDVVVEKYFNGYNAWDAHLLASVSKSFTSALIGIALEKGYLKSLDQKILSFFPQYKEIENLDDWKKMIDIGNLLTMRSGTDYHERDLYSPHGKLISLIVGWDRFYLNRPMITEPGTSFQYDSGGVILLSAILKSVCGMHADVFADKRLFPKLGITGAYWIKNWEKHPHTGGGLFMKPLDMAKFGQLYLNKGMWNGEQVIPANWVAKSFKMHVKLNELQFDNYTRGYGYLWWIMKPAKEGADSQYIYAARGSGGQRIFIIPEFDMILVVTAFAAIPRDLSGEKILYEHIIPAIFK